MSDACTAFTGAKIFDGVGMHSGMALLVNGAHVGRMVDKKDIPSGTREVLLSGGILAPGYVDLQVNGGGGEMFNHSPSVQTLRVMSAAHARIGATSILPTLITDTPEHTRAAINAVAEAVASDVPGVEGLHLEGPHLSLARKGAHDPALIRPMNDEDLNALIDAARHLPVLMVTIAPESVTLEQMKILCNAGIILSLGHSDANYADCQAAAKAGVSCATHLFNAMSQLTNREPGLVGAAVGLGELSCGLIADLIHVHPQSIAAAMRAKCGPGRVFLVSDAMATAGSDISWFALNGRRIERHGDKLSLPDGTLAGAHLELTTAVRNMVNTVGTDLCCALEMATSVPAELIGRGEMIGTLNPGAIANLVHIGDDLSLQQTWVRGKPVEVACENA